MATDKRQFTLRVQEENFLKIKKISELQKRSIAMQIEFLIEDYISKYESNHGIIEIEYED